MPPIPPRLSIADVWDETARFVRRESTLLLPIAFATTGLGALLWDLAAPVTAPGTRPAPGAWMLVLIPVTLLFLLGNIAVAALVLHPGISVREALQSAVARIGNALSVLLLFLGLALFATVVVSVIAMLIGLAIGWPPEQATGLGLMLVLPLVLFVAVRMLTLWPAVAAAPARPAPRAVVRTAWRSTQGLFGRLAAAMLLYAVGYVTILAAIQYGLGSVLLLAGRALGQPNGFALSLSVLSAMAGAAIQAVWGVFGAVLYRGLTPASTGI